MKKDINIPYYKRFAIMSRKVDNPDVVVSTWIDTIPTVISVLHKKKLLNASNIIKVVSTVTKEK